MADDERPLDHLLKQLEGGYEIQPFRRAGYAAALRAKLEVSDKAQALLEAAAVYWEEYNKTRTAAAAVVWLEDQNGRCVVITRGEYRDRMMAAVGEHISEPHYVGNCPECDGVGCAECGETGKYSG